MEAGTCLIDTRRGIAVARSPPLALLAEAVDDVDHFLPSTVGIDSFMSHAHGDLFPSVNGEKSLHEQMTHDDANEYTTVAAVILLRALVEVVKAQPLVEDELQSTKAEPRLVVIGAFQGVVVESDTINDTHEEQGPM